MEQQFETPCSKRGLTLGRRKGDPREPGSSRSGGRATAMQEPTGPKLTPYGLHVAHEFDSPDLVQPLA